ncbi:Na/Pi cotransporter family protein [Motiliproteus coralliicola]|uniref:Na/Pi cotransporter family protein n=1 Tax=Motiliproteus coralliicola TaxID=2283196 RepID=A0A369WN37_9GAMM|nr:Na/Pi symporter [Motiliproteus coralliicola]RDE22479.1 Na/Pi cotransporter family protein [Motiliproteus coralliicola]
MLRKALLPSIFILLAYGFWLSPDFKVISAGVALFLFGMLSLEEGFRAFSGGVLEKVLQRSTDRLWKSLGFGVLTTTLMQSSSLVSVITISFMSAGLLDLSAGIGIIFGANLGTTTGAWLVAAFGLKLKLSTYAMPMLVFGVILLFQRSSQLKGFGYILAGLGFLFLGIHYMKEGFETFKGNFDLAAYAVSGYPGLFLYAAIGTLATVVMQSSHATLILIITALSSNQISYENALALAIGANVGTTITAIIGAMGSNAQGRRLAGAHLIFNVSTGLVAILFITQLVQAVDGLGQWFGIADLDFTLKLALFHTLFNLLGVVMMLPLIQPMTRLLVRLIPEPQIDIERPRYMVPSAVQFPDTAVEAVRQETQRVFDNAQELIIRGLSMEPERVLGDQDLDAELTAQRHYTPVDIDDLYQRRIKSLFSAIIAFISEASFTWKEQQSGSLHWLRDANSNIVEAVKACKHLQKNMQLYLFSEEPAIRREYNQLRLQVVELLRQLDQLRQQPDENSVLSLDETRLTLLEWHREQHLRYYRLIRDAEISPEMGSSLINDAGYVATIKQSLLAAATTLFIQGGRTKHAVERDLALDDAELNEILTLAEQARRQL